MSNVLQILSSNYSGKSVNITFTSTIGDILSFDNVSLPYNFINDTFDGNYTLFFPDYNLTHKFQIPNVPVVNKCRCAEFRCTSFLNQSCKISYTGCGGNARSISMLANTSFRDCVSFDTPKLSKGATYNLYGYCNSLSDCVELTQPVTPTPTPTPQPTTTTTPTNTPTQTSTLTQTPSFTPSVTPTTSVGVTGECMCTTIRNLNDFEINVSFNLCKYPDWGNPYVVSTLLANEEFRVCAIYNTVSGDNISITYEYGVCEFDGAIRSCPSPTPTPTPTITPTPTYDDGQNSILVSGILFSGQTQTQGIFKYNYLSNRLTYLNISGIFNGLSHTFNFESQTGKIWASNGNTIKEYNIINSSFENELYRIISLTGTGYNKNLTFKDNNTLIKTVLSGNTKFVVEVDISESLTVPVTTFKFPITTFTLTDDFFMSDIMYTNNNKFIWSTSGTSELMGAVMEQYDYSTGVLEFQSPTCCLPSCLFQREGTINSIQSAAPVRFTYDLTTGENIYICPPTNCGPTVGYIFPCPNNTLQCDPNINFIADGGSSLLINNTASFVPNQPE
jgi:hypothetical protein